MEVLSDYRMYIGHVSALYRKCIGLVSEMYRTLLSDYRTRAQTEGGIGPDAFVFWLKSTYAADKLRARADGDDGTRAPFALENLLCELLAVLVRDNYSMTEKLTTRDRA